MPPPGPDFIRRAQFLAGDRPGAVDSYLRALYAWALYEDWFTTDIMVKGQPVLVRFIPGHFWGEERATGPRGRAKVMIIGKMPGKDEMRDGKYMAGSHGEYLAGALQSAGCGSGEYTGWYVTALMKFGNPNPASNALAKDWIKDCLPLLHQEIRLCQPEYILCLGSEAGKTLIGPSATVTNSTGKVFDYPIIRPDGTEYSAKLMTCLDPKAVVRESDQLPQLESSVRLFTRLVHGESIGAVETDLQHVVARTEPEALANLAMMIGETEQGGVIAVDCEWQGEQPTEPGSWLRTIQLSHKGKYALCLEMRKCGGAPNLSECPRVIELINRLFKRPNIRPVGHFHRADLPWLIHAGIDIRKEFDAPENPSSGWELTATEGGFDTGMAAHSYCETDDFKLEVQATRLVGCPRYDMVLQEAKKKLCADLKIGADDLPGYGDIPDEVLFPYACYDVDVTRRLFDVYNGKDGVPGLLDCDDYGNNCRMAFWISMRASPACLEMERTGLYVDIPRANALVDRYRITLAGKLLDLRETTKWPAFNVNSPFDCRELLFGPHYRGQVDKTTQEKVRGSPLDAVLCSLMPIKATGKNVKQTWGQIESNGEADQYTPATDKETLGILFHQTKDDKEGVIVGTLRDVRFLGQLLKMTAKQAKPKPKPKVRKPKKAKGKGRRVTIDRIPEPEAPVLVEVPVLVEDQEEPAIEGGLLSYICSDYRIYTHIFQTLETGRYASARPNLQNLSCDPETEFLTRNGWVKAPLLTADDLVAQYWPDQRTIDFVKPCSLVINRHTGHMCHIKSQDQIDMLVTPAHRCLLRRRKTGRWFETTAENYIGDCHHLHAGVYAGGSLQLSSDWVTWLCAVQADGHYHNNAQAIQFTFKKQRKIVRLCEALNSLGIDYSANRNAAGATAIYVKTINVAFIAETRRILGVNKAFGPWLLNYNRATLNLFAAEVFEWDGLSTRKTEYSSSNKTNTDWIQILWTLSGRRARMRKYHRNPNAAIHHIVDTTARLFIDYSLTTNFSMEQIPWDDNVYCVTVPSEFIVIRRNGKVSITGNSKRREADYKRIMGDQYLYPLRSIFVAPPGTVLIEADYVGAELAGMAWMSGDPTMTEHVRRAQLPENHPDYYDIHSAVAVAAFQLPCPPTKSGLEAIQKLHLRVAAKNVVFGYAYGRGAAAICRQAKEEGVVITVAEAQALIDGLTKQYPMLPIFFGQCRASTQDPQWMCNSFGRIRRFRPTSDMKTQGEQERQGMNFPIQSLVADAVSRALDHLYNRRPMYGLHYRIALQIHDAVLLEVPIAEAEVVYDKVLPECMTDLVPIYPCTLRGVPIPAGKRQNLAIDREMYIRWGEKLTKDDCRVRGIPERFGKEPKKK